MSCSAHEGHKRAQDLGLGLWMVESLCGCWKVKVGSLEEKLVLLAAELRQQTLKDFLIK